ncbi:hypothetical protein J6590_061014 [Homalodisca vitripennis]|nr:hypothetical protein J6590_061014 [Homalodisca vitripennis]
MYMFLIVATIQTLHRRWKYDSLEPEVHVHRQRLRKACEPREIAKEKVSSTRNPQALLPRFNFCLNFKLKKEEFKYRLREFLSKSFQGSVQKDLQINYCLEDCLFVTKEIQGFVRSLWTLLQCGNACSSNDPGSGVKHVGLGEWQKQKPRKRPVFLTVIDSETPYMREATREAIPRYPISLDDSSYCVQNIARSPSNQSLSLLRLGVTKSVTPGNVTMPVQWVRRTGSARDKADNCGSAARDKADNYVYS